MTDSPSAVQTFKTLETTLHTIHHNTYTYEKALYYNMHTKFIVTCKEHGDFSITPAHHKNGKGCKACASVRAATKRRSTTKQFLEKAKLIAPMYDYSKTTYIASDIKVTVTCSVHGDFFITPNKLLSGRRCPHCKGKRIAEIATKPYQQFVAEASTIHASKYTYIPDTYVNAKTPTAIVCPEHGVFYQTPDAHINNKNGCRKCAISAIAKARKSSTEAFIKKANAVHKYLYDYSLVSYVRNSVDVTIICPVHGKFTQAPQNHLAGKGCYLCNGKQYYSLLPTILYYVKLTHPSGEVAYKVGITTKSIQTRFRTAEIAGMLIEVLYEYHFLSGKQAFYYEQEFLKKYASYKRTLTSSFLPRRAGDSELFSCDVLQTSKS